MPRHFDNEAFQRDLEAISQIPVPSFKDSIRRSTEIWWDNLANATETLLSEGHLTPETTIESLLQYTKERCTTCGVPFAFHPDEDC